MMERDVKNHIRRSSLQEVIYYEKKANAMLTIQGMKKLLLD
jgi:hypothetical protein